MQKPSAIVLGTGRRLLYGDADWRVMADRADRASVISGALPITVEAFVEFDAGEGYERAVTTAATAVLWPAENHTTELTRVATMEIASNDNTAAALSLWGFQVSRWQATAAPRRLELDPDLARRLSLD